MTCLQGRGGGQVLSAEFAEYLAIFLPPALSCLSHTLEPARHVTHAALAGLFSSRMWFCVSWSWCWLKSFLKECAGGRGRRPPPPPESCQLCPRSPPTQSALGIAGFILRSFWCPPSSLEIRLFWNEGQHLKTSVQGNFTYEMVSCGFIPETVFNFCIPSNDLARSRLITGIQVMSVEWLNAPEGPYWSHPLSFQPSTWVPAEGRDSDSSSMAPDGQA